MNTQAIHSAEATPRNRVKTLLVDDSPLMLKVVAEILKHAGDFDLIGTASNGLQALRYVRMLSPELIVMDVHMPRLDGIQATRFIKGNEHPPIVVIATSDNSIMTRTAAELAGADGFVSKDLNLRRQMIDTLRKLFTPPEDMPRPADELSQPHGVTCNEKSQHQQTANKCSRCSFGGIATIPGKNPQPSERRMRRARRRGTHGSATMARTRATTRSKHSK
jgi:DNA-binding NarL/FixJ family response regulator